MLSGLIVYPLAEAKSVLQQYRDFVAKAPDELSVWTVLRQAPPLPFLPAEVHGKGIVALALLYAGDPKQGEPLIEPLRTFGTPARRARRRPALRRLAAGLRPAAHRPARATTGSPTISRRSRTGCSTSSSSTSASCRRPQCEIFFGAIGGATTRPAPDAAAYAHRDAQFVMNVHGRWEDPADDARCIGWARDFFKASAPFASGGVYVNFLTADEGDRVRAAYGPNYDRLAQVKRTYDPDNLFRMNQNIKPA